MEGSPPHLDLIDVVLGVGIFATFVVFAVCIWLLKREMIKKKAANQKDKSE